MAEARAVAYEPHAGPVPKPHVHAPTPKDDLRDCATRQEPLPTSEHCQAQPRHCVTSAQHRSAGSRFRRFCHQIQSHPIGKVRRASRYPDRWTPAPELCVAEARRARLAEHICSMGIPVDSHHSQRCDSRSANEIPPELNPSVQWSDRRCSAWHRAGRAQR